jgi:hypothetical protein
MDGAIVGRILRCRLGSAACLSLAAAIASAAILDDFEAPQASWKAGEADSQYRVLRQERIRGDAHSGQGSELIQISAATGSHVYFTHDCTAARIIAELTPSVWVKASRPGIQLLARIVLPHTVDPRSGRPVATLISGTIYASVGTWQQLEIRDVPRLLARQLPVVQAQISMQVDAREAYIDQLLLNLYAGPGETAVNIDDLEMAGVVPRAAASQPAAAISQVSSSSAVGPGFGGRDLANDGTAKNPTNAAPVSLKGSILEVNGRPTFPRIAQWQGEPLVWLKEAGFNAVRLPGPPTDGLLAEARTAGLWLISPPPAGDSAVGDLNLPVLAWQLGDGLSGDNLQSVTTWVRQLRQREGQVHRPLVAGATENLLDYSRQIDILSASRPVLGTSLELKDYGVWLNEQAQLARPGTPTWATVQSGVPPALVEQAAILTGNQSAAGVDSDSLRLAAYQALAAGVRGIEFGSPARLDAVDDATRLRAATIQLLNLELEFVEPWGAAGSYVTSNISNDSNITGAVLHTDRARLVIAMRCAKGSQFVAAPSSEGTSLPQPGTSEPAKPKKSGAEPDPLPKLRGDKPLERVGSGVAKSEPPSHRAPTRDPTNPYSPVAPDGPTTLVVPGVPESHEIYELTPVEVRSVRHRRVAGGTQIEIDDFVLTATVLITADPMVKNAMVARTAQLAPRAAKLERTIAGAMLADVEAVNQRLAGQTQLPSSATTIAAARTDLAQADQLLAAGDFVHAYYAARNATLPLGRWRREVWERTVKPLATPVSSPLAASFDTLPEYIRFAAAVTGQQRGENLLAGGDFENLSAMMQAGWLNKDHPQLNVRTIEELSPIVPYSGQTCLHLMATPVRPGTEGTMVESPPLWIESAPVSLAAGDIVCIRGQIRMPKPVTGSVDSLLVVDSLGGDALAQRIIPADGWREFVIYRAAPQAGPMKVTFVLSGFGEAWIDDVSVQLVWRGGTIAAGLPGWTNLPARR